MLASLRLQSSAARLCWLKSASRQYSTPSVAQLVKQLRGTIDGLPISKAREALEASNNDVNAALEWLSQDMALTGARKAAKSKDRKAAEGLVGLSVLSRGTVARPGDAGVRAAIVELNCETDFVARNNLFGSLLDDIAHTAAYFAEHRDAGNLIPSIDIGMLEGAPLMSASGNSTSSQVSVGDAIKETIAKTGELIVLRRAAAAVHGPIPPSVSQPALRVSSYAHGGLKPNQGRIATLAILSLSSPDISTTLAKNGFLDNLVRLERSLARQIVGFETTCVSGGEQDGTALYSQPFTMLSGATTDLSVGEYLRKWSSEHGLGSVDGEVGTGVVGFEKWMVGGD